MRFEWDPAKAETNLKKHGVAFAEAATVFADPLSETFPDPDHSLGELRYVTIGQSIVGRLRVVGHTDREEALCIITPRRATPREKRCYENPSS